MAIHTHVDPAALPGGGKRQLGFGQDARAIRLAREIKGKSMRLTTMTDYAIRLLMYVGRQPDRLCTISEIAHVYGMSEPHLMKITHRLAQNGWIETVRGKNGGMRLAHDPKDISLGAVMRDTESDFTLVECFVANNACPLSGHCRLTGIIDGALQRFLQYVDSFTLADILPETGQAMRVRSSPSETQESGAGNTPRAASGVEKAVSV